MTICIYTIHACNNYGAMLQAYALVQFLNEHGYHSEIVNLITEHEENLMNYKYKRGLKNLILRIYAMVGPKARKKKNNFAHFHSILSLSKRYISKEDLINNPPQYDINIVGSDQVWNMEYGIDQAKLYFLPNVKGYKISYASSFGNIIAAEKYKDQIREYLSSFSSISVREQDAVNFLNCNNIAKAEHVLDPTFLLNSKQWSEIAGESPLISGNYVLYYGFDTNKDVNKILSYIRSETCLQLIGVSVSLHSPYKFDKFYQEAGPIELLNLIKNASLIVTSSFHGLALSIIFHKSFIVLRNGTRMSRMESLLELFGIKNRIADEMSQVQGILAKGWKMDYTGYIDRVNSEINRSKQWLVNNLPHE